MVSKKPIRWGILGTGWVAQRFMADLATVDGAVRAAVASRSQKRAAEIATAFRFHKAYGSYEALCAGTDTDVIYVASDHHEHAQHCLMAMQNGKHVLCEKPFATSPQEAASVIRCAQERNLFCMEAMWTRFIPAVRKFKALVDSGTIGTPRHLAVDFGVPVRESKESRLFDPARGGGAMLDRGVYGIALAVWFFGKPTEIVSQAVRAKSGVDSTCSVVLRFPDGQLAVVTASLDALSANEAVMAGTGGRLKLCEPFYGASRVSLNRIEAATGMRGDDIDPTSFMLKLRLLASQAKAYVPPALLRTSTVRMPVGGFGYSYEAEEVTRCLREGLTESSIMPLTETQTIADVIAQVHSQISGR